MFRGRALLGVALLVASGGVLAACSTGSKPAPKELLPPEKFRAAAEELTASLSWSTNPETATVGGFELFRDSMRVADLEADVTSYVDNKITAGKRYTYELRAIGGGAKSKPVTATITLAVPPLRTARLDGLFDIDVKVVSSSGFKKKLVGQPYSWRFTPKCQEGTCRVEWRDLDLNAHGILEPKGATYSGSYRGYFDITCAGAPTTSRVKIRLKVTEARAMSGVWRATQIRGTVTASSAPQLACVAAKKRESLQGRFIG